jgi:hypothetical protein
LSEGCPKASPSPSAISHVGTNEGQIFVFNKVKKERGKAGWQHTLQNSLIISFVHSIDFIIS